MARPPSAAEHRAAGYLVAAPQRPNRTGWIVAVIAGAAVVLTASALLVATIVTGGPITATPSLSPAPASETDEAVAADGTAESIAGVVNGREFVLQLPAGQEAIGRVVLFPDRGQEAAAAVSTGDAVALLRAGWAVAAYEGAGTDYGSPAGQSAVVDLLAWSATALADAGAPADPLVVATYGTGAATALAGVAVSGAVPTCWASSQPVTDLVGAAIADPALEGEIVAAWGGVPAQDELPRTHVAALPADTLYRVLAPPASAPATAREDAATLVSALEESGHDVTTVELGAARADLLTALRGCEA